MNKTHSILAILLILIFALLVFPAVAQESNQTNPELSLAVLGIPPMLSFLIGVNNRGTQFVKLWLAAPKLPINLPPETQRVVVSISSLGIGIVAAIFVPNALSWLPERFQTYPIAAVFLVAIASSFGGALAQYVLEVLGGVGKWLAANNTTVLKTTTEVSTPSSDVSTSTANKTLDVAAQVAKQ